ncbi:MAG: hypothetical protein LBM87_06485 [Ruminococcus sp.]|jgi:hypothetical protein|nr:hypothetical protein [Ruminococcus sp.]
MAKNNPKNNKKITKPKLPETEKKHSGENLKIILGSALTEDVNIIENLVAEESTPVVTKTADAEKIRKRVFFILGVFVVIMSVIGIFATAEFISARIEYFADNTKQKNEFAEFIYPVVICDPPPFGMSVKMRDETIISTAIWDIILYADKTNFTADFDNIIVPELTVEQHAIKLYGDDISFTHKSILGSDVQFYYLEELKSYRIPAMPRYFSYSPFIENISSVGERYTLTVGYVAPSPSWYQKTGDDSPVIEKSAEYILQKRNNVLKLIAINQIQNVNSDNSDSL